MSRHLVFRALNVCLLALLTLFCLAVVAPLTALAQAKKAIAVGLIEGPQGDATRKNVLKTLKATKQYEITDAEDLRPGSNKSAYSSMAQALQVDAIIVGKVSRGHDLTLSVIGPDGNLIEDVKLKGGSAPKLKKAVDSELEPAIAGSLGAKKAGKKAEAEPAPEDEEEESVPGAGAGAAAAAGGDSEEDEEDERATAARAVKRQAEGRSDLRAERRARPAPSRASRRFPTLQSKLSPIRTQSPRSAGSFRTSSPWLRRSSRPRASTRLRSFETMPSRTSASWPSSTSALRRPRTTTSRS